MKPHRFHPAALAEYREAVLWYGVDGAESFAAAVDSAIDELCEHPARWSFWPGRSDVRRRVLRDPFPYSIAYLDEPSLVWIVAVAHQKRRPGYWIPRLRRRR